MTYTSALKPKLIYVFRINDETHKGLLKIGEATMDDEDAPDISDNSETLNAAARKRIDSYTHTAGIAYELLHTETALVFRRSGVDTISDKDVHLVLERSGKNHHEFPDGGGVEWFPVDLETAKKAIAAAKKGQASLSPNEITTDKSPIILRDEQKAAIAMAKKNIKNGNSDILWNAKMRFGKTLTALSLINELKYKRTIILTHRPVVDKGWFEDYSKIFDNASGYVYISKSQGEKPEKAKQFASSGKPFIYFASMQDLRGSKDVGGKFDKNNDIFSIDWQLVIIDEAHEGTQTELGQNVIKALRKDETKVLHLSGTPFNIISGFKEEQIYTWDYVMEQQMKTEWDKTHFGDSNPYATLPKLNIYTFDLGELLGGFEDDDHAFNFTEFFRVWTGVPKTDRRQMPANAKVGEFIHKDDILRFLNLITTEDEDSFYPYANEAFRNNFRHSLWMVPGVKEAQALSKMLKAHPVFGQFDVVNVAGNGDEDEENDNALKMVLEKISDNPDETRTITLSCGRLTTGVTVPAWTAVFMLAGSYSTAASTYMQTIFRVQSPATINGRMKEECFVFDFAPDRTLKVVAEAAKVSAKKAVSQSDSALMGDLLNFMPIISVSGTQMTPYNVERMLAKLKEAYIDRVVANGFEDTHIYDRDALMQLNEVELNDFDGLKKIIGETKPSGKVKDIIINDQGFDDEQHEKQESDKKTKRGLSDEDKKRQEELKQRRKQRDAAVSILRGISIRIPLLMYGAETKNDEDITLNNFASLIDDQSWIEFMPKGVDKKMFKKFSKYYDKDIFREAGKRIRFMARKADELPVTERIERIAQIFGTFRNPDKETVLTPWRVVNMHLSDTVGGYCFYSEDFPNEPAEKPRFVDRGEPTAVIFRKSDARILEINSKTGLYPLYMAYSFFRCQCDAVANILGSFDSLTMEQEHQLWDKTLAQNIFVVCRTQMAVNITRRTLAGFRTDVRTNICHFNNILTEITENKENFIKQVSDGRGFWNANNTENMKFDAIVGNPPYQEITAKKETDNGQKRSKSIFQYFQIISDSLGKYVSLIYPGGRWIHRSGKGMAEFGLKQINDPHLEKLIFYADANDLFNVVGIADGISIVFKNTNKQTQQFKYEFIQEGIHQTIDLPSPGENLIPLNPSDLLIVDKIVRKVNQHNFNYLDKSVLSQKLFSIESDFVEQNPTLVREFVDGAAFDKGTEIKLLTNDKAGKSGRAKWYIAKKDVITTGREYLNKWKVVVSSANAGGQKRSNQMQVLDNYSAFGRSRVALKTFDTEKEALNFFTYAKSKFIRFAFLMTDESLTSLAKLVPDIGNYKDNNGIIDFKKDVDKQLFELFGITEQQQNHIQNVLSKKKE